MRAECERALDTAKALGATYADARIVQREVQQISVKNGKVESLTHEETLGIGVRVLANGAWGFAASASLTPSELDRTAALAVQLAKAAAQVHRKPVDLGTPYRNEAAYKTPVRIDPFTVPLGDKIAPSAGGHRNDAEG